jgi:predicted RNase H-like HicB family nuclease
MAHSVVLHHDEEGYSVHFPELPGCWSHQEETEEEALTNIQSAIRECLCVAIRMRTTDRS